MSRQRHHLLDLAVAALAATACASSPSPELSADADKDGVTVDEGDCDDFNNTVHPGATDFPGDGLDQDCSGGDAAVVPPAPAEDLDGDGVKVADGDCDDKNSAIHPGARERSFDGVDPDCDKSDLPSLGDNRYDAAVGIVDTDKDGAISLAEFSAACEKSAMVVGKARAGVVQVHSSCSGTSSCRGMVLHPWKELFEHDCSGVNYCKGWSCVEAAQGADRDGAKAYEEAGCADCHGDHDNTASKDFMVKVPAGEDVAAFVTAFPSRSDDRFRAVIAFGASGVTPAGNAYQNMPGHLHKLSRQEIDAVIAHIRTLPLKGVSFTPGDAPADGGRM